jgi:hypothetical protein
MAAAVHKTGAHRAQSIAEQEIQAFNLPFTVANTQAKLECCQHYKMQHMKYPTVIKCQRIVRLRLTIHLTRTDVAPITLHKDHRHTNVHNEPKLTGGQLEQGENHLGQCGLN